MENATRKGKDKNFKAGRVPDFSSNALRVLPPTQSKTKDTASTKGTTPARNATPPMTTTKTCDKILMIPSSWACSPKSTRSVTTNAAITPQNPTSNGFLSARVIAPPRPLPRVKRKAHPTATGKRPAGTKKVKNTAQK